MVSVMGLDPAVWVRALAGGTALRSWARHFTLIVPVYIQVYKWVSGISKCNAGGKLAMDKHPIPEGVEIHQVASSYRDRI